jgi:diguanylate cyclase (GGDEF)-like protein
MHEENPRKISTRLLVFLLGLRWGGLIVGLLFFSLKILSHAPPQNLGNAPLFVLIIGYEVLPSLLQWKISTSKALGFLLVFADFACGVVLMSFWGSAFFILSALLPICEAFLISDAFGIVVAAINLAIVFGFVIREIVSPPGDADVVRLVIRLLGGESLLAALIFWLFLLAQSSEFEVARREARSLEDKKLLQAELRKSEMEVDRLFKEILESKKELEKLQAAVQTKQDLEREEILSQLEQIQKEKEEVARQLADALKEVEETQKERQNLSFLVETSGQMHKSLQLEETLVTVVEILEKVLPSQTCIIFLTERDKNEEKLYAEVAASPYADYFRNYSVCIGEGVVGWVAKEKEPAIIENGSLRTAEGVEFKTLLSNEKSAIVAPLLKKDGSPLGVIYLGEQKPKAYSWQDVNVLLRFIPHIQNAIAKAKEYHEAISQGLQDPVTGLFNSVYFEERLSEELKRAYRYQLPLSLILLQIDRYESQVASLGEGVEKAILREVGELLKEYLRDVDVLARIGEGKFAILLVQADRGNAVIIADRIRLAIEMRVFGESVKQKIKLTASEGVAGYPKDALYKSDLIAKCEAGLQEALSKGGNKTCTAAA